jgi:hypothetical protein
MHTREPSECAAQCDKEPQEGKLDMLQIFIASTAAFLTAGRFGLAPTAKKHTKAGLKLYDDDSEGEHLRRRNQECTARNALPPAALLLQPGCNSHAHC